MNLLRLQLGKLVLLIYRWMAILLLYSVLLGVCGYIGVMGFYVFSTTWVAPLLISPSNTQILTLTQSLTASQVQLEAFQLDRDRQQVTVDVAKVQLTALSSLNLDLSRAIIKEVASNKVNGPDLQILTDQKKTDIASTAKLMKDIETVKDRIAKELTAGLITKGDAAQQLAALNQITNGYTDSKIGEVLLRDNVREKQTDDIATMDALTKKATIAAQIAQFAVLIKTGQEQIKTDTAQIETLTKAMETAKHTPYYLASVASHNQAFAFVPYDNLKNVKVGAPVYDCYLNMAACRYSGAVKAVFSDEEHTTHPMFKTDLRGVLIQLDLTRPKVAQSKTLFVGGKPLLF